MKFHSHGIPLSDCLFFDLIVFIYLLIRMTIVVMMAARKTNPPKTPRAMIPPKINDVQCRNKSTIFSVYL